MSEQKKGYGSLTDVIRLILIVSLPTVRKMRASMTTASPKPSIIQLSMVNRTILPVNGLTPSMWSMVLPASFSLEAPPLPPPLLPAPRASCSFRASQCPFILVSRCCLKWVREPNLTPASAKSRFTSQSLHTVMPGTEVDRENFPQRVVGSERLAAPLLMLHAVFLRSRALTKVVCGLILATTSMTGFSTLSVGNGCARADAVGTVERDGPFRPMCVCVDRPLCAAVSQGMRGVSAARTN